MHELNLLSARKVTTLFCVRVTESRIMAHVSWSTDFNVLFFLTLFPTLLVTLFQLFFTKYSITAIPHYFS